jgi:hypothetical protein
VLQLVEDRRRGGSSSTRPRLWAFIKEMMVE